MKQEGLLNCVIEALGLDDGTVNGKATPDEVKFLVKDKDGDVAHGDFSYNNIVGMMLYLSSHSRSDIAYAINCAACYMFCPRHSHELALQMIGRYLKATHSRGLILNPSSNLKIDCYPDADFAVYGHEKINDGACVKSRTGYVITRVDYPAPWQSKL